MFKQLGMSVYLSNFAEWQAAFGGAKADGPRYIFTSFHIGEEVDDTYCERMKAMCDYLHDHNYRIIGDVSRETLQLFNRENIVDFSREIRVDILRLDDGFSLEEICDIAEHVPVCLNASTLTEQDATALHRVAGNVYAMHNYYPRPETGLDEAYFEMVNERLRAMKVQILAFIPGDIIKRGPLYEGLPTLEQQRYSSPYSAYVELREKYQIDGIFVGDGWLSSQQEKLIREYQQSSKLCIPYEQLTAEKLEFAESYTIRADSPRWIRRLQESRAQAVQPKPIKPENCIERQAGCITVDNCRYLRYSGEVQIVAEDLPGDERVNVIGRINKENLSLLKQMTNGRKIYLVKIGQ